MDITKQLKFDIGTIGQSPIGKAPSNPKSAPDGARLKREKLYKADGLKSTQTADRRIRTRLGQKVKRGEALANRRQIVDEDDLNEDDNQNEGPNSRRETRRTRMSAAVQNRMRLLEEFKKKKQEKKEQELKQKKRPFLVGKVHYGTPLAELEKISTVSFNFGGKTPKATPSRVFTFKGQQGAKVASTILKGGNAKNQPKPQSKPQPVPINTGRVTRSRTAALNKQVTNVKTISEKKPNTQKATDKTKISSVTSKAKTISSPQETIISSPTEIEVTPVTKVLKKPSSRVVTPFPKTSVHDSDVDSEEERDVVPEVLIPITPRSTRKTPRRMGEVARLMDTLRPGVCFERGSVSDRKKRSGRRSFVGNDIVPLEREIEDMDSLIESMSKLKGHQAKTAASPKDADDTNLYAKPMKLIFDSPIKSPRIVVEGSLQKQEDLKRFRNLLESETKRLSGLCCKWEQELAESKIADNDEISGRVRVAIGKAKILMDQKGRFQQFRTLINNCEFNLGEKPTTCMDLQGFWDMIDFQINDITAAFARLDELKENDWIEEIFKPTATICKVKPIFNTRKPAEGAPRSSLKALIAAKRKAMKNGHRNLDANDLLDPRVAVTFDGGFFEVKSPAKRKTPRRKSLSVSVNRTPMRLSAMEKKSNPNSPLAIIKVTSSARRSISILPDTQVSEVQDNQENLPNQANEVKNQESTQLQTPKKNFSVFASAASFGSMVKESPVEKKTRKSQKLNTSDLILFDTPKEVRTVRRSARLSGINHSYK